MEFPGLPARIDEVQRLISERQARAGWTHAVTVIAVTKTHGPEAVQAAVRAGLSAVGENRVQEALAKQNLLPQLQVEWHLIGTLQRNKARLAAGRFAVIHSVDRADLATELDRRHESDQPQRILIQVNCSGEQQKGGVEPDGLPALLEQIAALRKLRVAGLMTLAELSEDPGIPRAAFRKLRKLRDDAERQGHRLPELSMGMSGDYLTAVEEGATMVRLGTLLFGERGI